MTSDILEERIESAIVEMEYHLDRLGRKEVKLTQYTVPAVSVTDLTATGDGGTLAQVEVDIRKDPAKYRRGTEYRYYKDLEEYWTIGAKYHLRKERLSLASKAVILLQVKQNLINNFRESDRETVDRLSAVIDDLIRDLIEAREKRNEVDTFSVRLDTIRKRDVRLENVRTLKIVKFHKGIFLDPRNRKRLLEHEWAGEFDRGIPCRFNLARQIIFE